MTKQNPKSGLHTSRACISIILKKQNREEQKNTHRDFNTVPAKRLIMLPSFPTSPRRT